MMRDAFSLKCPTCGHQFIDAISFNSHLCPVLTASDYAYHVTIGSEEHKMSKDCWCKPRIVKKFPGGNRLMYVHRFEETARL